jgi:hypothetical protein
MQPAVMRTGNPRLAMGKRVNKHAGSYENVKAMFRVPNN